MGEPWNFDPTCMDVARANIYGCTPCSKCGGKYRHTFQAGPRKVFCSDCGYCEPRRDKSRADSQEDDRG